MTLQEIKDLSAALVVLDKDIAVKQEALDALTVKRNEFARKVLVDAFQQAGVTEISLEDGSKLSLSSKYVGSVPKDERSIDAYDWLRANNHGGLIKAAVSVDVGQDARLLEQVKSVLKGCEIPFATSENVHHSTLNAFINEMMEVNPADFPRHLFGVNLVEEVKVKKARG